MTIQEEHILHRDVPLREYASCLPCNRFKCLCPICYSKCDICGGELVG